jgi:uncharacterized Zn-finger protein
MKIIAYIAAAILIFFGVLFIWAAFAPDAEGGWLLIGIISVLIGFGLIWFASRPKPLAPGQQNVNIQVDLPANVNIEKLKCQSCGGALDPQKDIKLVAGAPMVTCPYCGTTYQLTEDPKW